MKKIQLNCSICGNSFEKELKEYKRRTKLGKTSFYCGLQCSGKRTDNKKLLIDIGKQHQFKGGENKILTYDGFILAAMKEFNRRIRRRHHFSKEIGPDILVEIWKNQNGKCVYTNVDLVLPNSNEYKATNKNYKASIDRIDSSKPYSLENIQFVSLTVNNLKSDMIDSELHEFFNIIKNKLEY
jgi:hypothetical protein